MNLYKGRRRELISAAVLYLVGAVVTGVAPNFAVMVIGRFIYGIGIGLVMCSMLLSKHKFLLLFFFKHLHILLITCKYSNSSIRWINLIFFFLRQCMLLQCTLQRRLLLKYEDD